MAIVRKIFEVLQTPLEPDNQVAASERKMLQRGYFSFLAAIVNCNISEVLSNQGNYFKINPFSKYNFRPVNYEGMHGRGRPRKVWYSAVEEWVGCSLHKASERRDRLRDIVKATAAHLGAN